MNHMSVNNYYIVQLSTYTREQISRYTSENKKENTLIRWRHPVIL